MKLRQLVFRVLGVRRVHIETSAGAEMKLYAIVPLEDDLLPVVMCTKIDGANAAVLAFKTTEGASGYVKTRLAPGSYKIQELTVEEFDRAKSLLHSPEVALNIKVLD